MTFQPGDRVTWLHEPRGGYGYTVTVDATVLKVGAKRVQIEALLGNGRPHRVWVTPERLRSAA